MCFKGKSIINLAIGVCFLALLLSSPVQGEPRYDIHNDQVAHGAFEYNGVINSPPAQNSAGEAEIIIDDKVYLLRGDCIYRNLSGRLIGMSSFNTGMSVNFFALDEMLITKLWQVGEEENEDEAPSELEYGAVSDSPVDDDIRLEGGVWTN